MITNKIIHSSLLILFSLHAIYSQVKSSSFKMSQLKHKKVEEAYITKWVFLEEELKKKDIKTNNFSIYLRAFKHEGELEVWVKNKNDVHYKLFKIYAICASSGILGPKRKEGDGQVPEGFYEIDLFNHKSDYYLSLRINYPNNSDLILKDGPNAGGAIMIHGNCVTIGCLPITDDKIKELYVLCVEAKSKNNPIYIDVFPIRFTDKNLTYLEKNYPKSKLVFWNMLRPGYDYFEEHKWLPKVNINKKGYYFYEE